MRPLKFSRVAQCRFFLTASSVCRGPNCPPHAGQSKERVGLFMGQIVNGSDCQSERLDPLLRGLTERFWGGQTIPPLWGWMVSICKRLWGESLQCRIVWVGVSQFLNGRWPNHQGTGGGGYSLGMSPEPEFLNTLK